MSLRPIAPYNRLMIAMVECARLVDFADEAGVTEQVTARHYRNRSIGKSEMPGIAFIFVNDKTRVDERNHNTWETTRELEIDIRYQLELATEGSGDDETGFITLGRMDAALMAKLNEVGSPLRILIQDDVVQGEIDPTDKGTPDEGRLVRGATVVYRVLTADQNVLLAEGVMG